jgi:hypothetical protein
MTERDPPIFWEARRLLGIRDADEAPQIDCVIQIEIERAKEENRRIRIVNIENMLDVRKR